MKQLNKNTAEKLQASIPANIIEFADLNVDIEYRPALFRFQDNDLCNIYMFIHSNEGDKYIMKFKYPELEFTHIYINTEEAFEGIVEKRYDANLVVDAEYEWFTEGMKNPNEYMAAKIKEYDADGNVTVLFSPYKLSRELAPINIDCIAPYVEKMYETHQHFYKEQDPSARYISWEECDCD